ncbi:nicotinate (nicotinamide) nucleotide adenylyltransferase [Oculatella sp. LEGE 06141]|uniref:nicotinate (nicotinamide) nucleotide adenylyltransferase n=1 Tax=Oculatella sp. LEGE 06141 TaxID=1828648 RepID=UPI00187F5EFC|nr:nicotinate (nicotinamide) nucleotide adenylyltransferase [Oculatella sp. LEGE 06141]MBE9181304.1 nicotinate (nicotinamide) nucleotide adenylyltransferase [Oculatella sp. LEGE 06141]
MQHLAILGGTFNPVHWGHLLLAETALSQLALDKILWVPTHCPPYKSQIELLSFEQRSVMVEQAIASHPAFALSTVEQRRSGSSYAIDTLNDLQQCHPASQWYWIVGLDAFQSLPRWYHRRELASHCQWLIAPRVAPLPRTADAQHQLTIDLQQRCEQVVQALAQQAIPVQWQILQMPLVEISSSLVRQYCRDRRSIRYLVPDVVREYILAHQLYQTQEHSQINP